MELFQLWYGVKISRDEFDLLEKKPTERVIYYPHPGGPFLRIAYADVPLFRSVALPDGSVIIGFKLDGTSVCDDGSLDRIRRNFTYATYTLLRDDPKMADYLSKQKTYLTVVPKICSCVMGHNSSHCYCQQCHPRDYDH